MRNAEKADRLRNVEDQSSDYTDAELPLEAEPDVDEHRNERQPGCEQAIAKKLATHPRADHLNPPDLDLGERFGDARGDHPLRVLQLRLVVEANENISGRTEFLYSQVAKTERRKSFPDRIGRQRLRAAQLDHDPAMEIDPKVQSRIEEQNYRNSAEHRGCNQAGEAAAHELNRCAVGNQAKCPHECFFPG